jgi:hypothetical protein
VQFHLVVAAAQPTALSEQHRETGRPGDGFRAQVESGVTVHEAVSHHHQ